MSGTPCPLLPSLELPTASATAAPRPGLRSPPRRWLWPLLESPPHIPAHRTCWVLKLLNVLELAGDVFVTPSGQGPSSVPSAQEHGGPERGWGDQRTRPSGQWRPQEKPQGSLRPRFMWRLWAVEGSLPRWHQEPHPAALLCCLRGSGHGATEASTIGQGWSVGISGWKGAHSARPHWSHHAPSAHVAMVIGGCELLTDVFISHLGPGDKDT